MLWRTAEAITLSADPRPQAPAAATQSCRWPLAALLCLGCAASPASEVSDQPIGANAALVRVEDRSLYARLGGPSAIAAIAGYWAEQTQLRTRLPFETGVRRAQYLLDCTVGHGRDAPPPSAPVPLALEQDSPADLLLDLRQTLRHLRITAPEQQELLQNVQRFLRQ